MKLSTPAVLCLIALISPTSRFFTQTTLSEIKASNLDYLVILDFCSLNKTVAQKAATTGFSCKKPPQMFLITGSSRKKPPLLTAVTAVTAKQTPRTFA